MQILFLGPPGAGKGTQCQRLAAKLNMAHLSSGDLLREAVAAGTPTGVKANDYMVKGQLVPDDVLIAMFGERLQKPDCSTGFILDGFPRNVAQAEALDKLLVGLEKSLSLVVNLTVDENQLKERLVGRRSCSNKACNTIYHVKFAPPKQENVCDKCGSELKHRSDDKDEVVGARLKTYNEQTAPLIDYYQKGGLVRVLNGDGPPDQIFGSLIKLVAKPGVPA